MIDTFNVSADADKSVTPNTVMIVAMAVAAGIAAANIYYAQPMMGIIAVEFQGSVFTRLIPPATQLGYALGLFFLVPLGDIMEGRRLIASQLMVLGCVLAGATLAPSAGVLVLASLLIGVCSTVAQEILPFTASIATRASRGRTVSAVLAGLLCGILLSRTFAGFVADRFGWRSVFGLAVPLTWLAAVAMVVTLPRTKGSAALSYGAALRSLVHLWRAEPALRRSALVQATLFGCQSAFWAVLALYLKSSTFNLGPDAAGLFGLAGVAGVVVAPIAGRLADRYGPSIVLRIGAVLILLAWTLCYFWRDIGSLIAAVVLLDMGANAAFVSNQQVIYALRPDAYSRLNTLYMTTAFLGGAVSSMAAIVAWGRWGWTGVSCASAGVAFILLSAITLTGEPIFARVRTR